MHYFAGIYLLFYLSSITDISMKFRNTYGLLIERKVTVN